MSEIRRLGGDTNAVVVQLPERAMPGVVIQRDSIENILALLMEADRYLNGGELVEAQEVLAECIQITAGYTAVFK